MPGHRHRKVQDGVGELQELQPRRRCLRRYPRSYSGRSHYPTADLQSIGGGYAKGLSDAETQQLEDEVEDTANKMADDIDLFGDTDGDGRAR